MGFFFERFQNCATLVPSVTFPQQNLASRVKPRITLAGSIKDKMINSLTTPVAIVTVVALVFLLLIHHLCCLIDCANTDDFSKSTKTGWIIFLQLTSLFGGLCYALFGTRSGVLRGSTILAVLATIGGIWFLCTSQSSNALSPQPMPVPTKAKVHGSHKHPVTHAVNSSVDPSA